MPKVSGRNPFGSSKVLPQASTDALYAVDWTVRNMRPVSMQGKRHGSPLQPHTATTLPPEASCQVLYNISGAPPLHRDHFLMRTSPLLSMGLERRASSLSGSRTTWFADTPPRQRLLKIPRRHQPRDWTSPHPKGSRVFPRDTDWRVLYPTNPRVRNLAREARGSTPSPPDVSTSSAGAKSTRPIPVSPVRSMVSTLWAYTSEAGADAAPQVSSVTSWGGNTTKSTLQRLHWLAKQPPTESTDARLVAPKSSLSTLIPMQPMAITTHAERKVLAAAGCLAVPRAPSTQQRAFPYPNLPPLSPVGSCSSEHAKAPSSAARAARRPAHRRHAAAEQAPSPSTQHLREFLHTHGLEMPSRSEAELPVAQGWIPPSPRQRVTLGPAGRLHNVS